MGLAVVEYLVEKLLFSSLKIQAGILAATAGSSNGTHQLRPSHSPPFCAGCVSYWRGDGGAWRGHQEGCHGWSWLHHLVSPEGGLHL